MFKLLYVYTNIKIINFFKLDDNIPKVVAEVENVTSVTGQHLLDFLYECFFEKCNFVFLEIGYIILNTVS